MTTLDYILVFVLDERAKAQGQGGPILKETELRVG